MDNTNNSRFVIFVGGSIAYSNGGGSTVGMRFSFAGLIVTESDLCWKKIMKSNHLENKKNKKQYPYDELLCQMLRFRGQH